MKRHHLSGALALAVLALGACSSTPPPREELAASRSALVTATSAAATEAPLELAAARDKIEQANLAMARKDYKAARQLAEQAEADVSVAVAKAQANRSDRQLMEVQESIRLLREQSMAQQ